VHCAEGPRCIQGADPEHDSPDAGEIHATGRRGAGTIVDWMAQLLRLLSNPARARPPGSFLRWTKTHLFSDPMKATIVDELEIPLLSFTDWWPPACAPKTVRSA
jgi:hypothetical protein